MRRAPKGVLALAILKVIVDEGWAAGGASELAMLRGAVGGVDLAAAATASGVPAETIKRLAHEAAASKGGLALGGGVGVTGANATETQIAINLLNVALGAYPKLVRFGGDSAFGKASPYAEMLSLTEAMGKGEVEVLILADVNPVFTMPPKSGFAEALGKVPLVVSLANRPNETASRAGLVLPALHPLESWGDFAAEDGVIGLMQPTMGPVQIDGKPVAGKSTGDILLSVGRQVLGEDAAKGPLKWASFEELREGRVEEARQGLRGRAALHRLLAGLSRARGRLALRAGRGGGAQGRPAANRAGGRQARRGTDRTRSSSTRPRASTTAGAPTSRGCRKRRTS